MSALVILFVLILFGTESAFSQVPVPESVVASSFGFDGNDSTEFIQAAIDSGAQKVIVDKQATPWVVRPLTLRSNLELVLQEGVEIVAKPGEFASKGDVLLRAANVSNLTIRGEGAGATLKMRKHDYWAAPYEKSEWRHGLSILSSSNVRIENLTIAETGGDGIYLGVATHGVPCRDIVIKNVDCVENNRQGISVISVDGLLIEDSKLRNTNGTAPEAGIDFEPNMPDEQISRVVMRNVIAENNAGDGITFYLPNLKANGPELTIEIDNCKSINNRCCGFGLTVANGPDRTLPGKIVVKNTELSSNSNGIAIRSKWRNGAPVEFQNVKITTPNATPNANPEILAARKNSSLDTGIALIAVGTDVDTNGGISFENVEIVDKSEKLLLTLRDASSEGVGFSNICGTIRSTCSETGKSFDTRLDDTTIKELFPELASRRIPSFDLTQLNTEPELSAELAAAWKNAPQPNGKLRARGSDILWFFAEKNTDYSWSMKQVQIGNYPMNPGQAVLTTPGGDTVELDPVPDDGSVLKYNFQARETGWHKILVEFGASSLVLSDESMPLLTAARPNLNLIGTTGEFAFYVPKNSPDLGIRIVGSDSERVTATLIDPDGMEVAKFENIPALATWAADEDASGNVIPPKTGFWRIRFEKPTVGILEDYILTISGVPALLR